MGIEDIQISEELETNAPSIKYRGNEGPKSPQEMEQMMIASLEEEYAKYKFDMLEQGLEPMSLQKFIEQAMAEGQMSGGQPLPSDPTKPVNPFQPKPTGPVLPDRQMAAYGGIMGLDGRKQYGAGSFFQKYIKDPFEAAVTGKTFIEIENESQARVDREQGINRPIPEGYDLKTQKISDITPIGNPEGTLGPQEGFFDTLLKGEEVTNKKTGAVTRQGGIDKYIIPAIGGITAGLFTKNSENDTPGLPSDTTAIALDDLKKSANILDQKQGLAAGLNFLPTVASRKYTPAQMLETYQTAANGGRIGMAEGGLMDLGGMEKDYRAEGGFVPIGKQEKADDVPARLSVNEFVFTADAVRNAGGGDIDQGAKVMENMMKHLEAGGQVSEESQGMAGARDMFEVSERLSEVV